MTEPNENEYTRNGVRYVAMDDGSSGGCYLCARRGKSGGCLGAPECNGIDRPDGRHIHWVVAK